MKTIKIKEEEIAKILNSIGWGEQQRYSKLLKIYDAIIAYMVDYDTAKLHKELKRIMEITN